MKDDGVNDAIQKSAAKALRPFAFVEKWSLNLALFYTGVTTAYLVLLLLVGHADTVDANAQASASVVYMLLAIHVVTKLYARVFMRTRPISKVGRRF